MAKSKPARQSIILDIITEHEIETQNQLMEALAAKGIRSTQAHFPDIKDMRLVKELGANGRYHYTSPAALPRPPAIWNAWKKIFKECSPPYATAQNIIVIKTLPGLANAACSTLDSMSIPDLVGSLAGDDTAFLAMTNSTSAEHLCREISSML